MGAGRGRRWQFAVVAALVALVAVGAAAPTVSADAQTTIVFQPADSEGGLTLVSSSDDSTGQSIEVDLVPDKPVLPNKIRIEVPRGYKLDLDAKPGTEIGDASVAIVGPDSPSFAVAFGSLVAKEPTAASAESCAPGTHEAVWVLATSLGGQQLTVTVDVDRAAQAALAYVLHVCTSKLVGDANAGASITLGIYSLVAPTAPGDYRWRTVVTPQTRAAYELQAVLPLPESLTLKAAYDRKRKTAILSGKVIEGGTAVAGAPVLIQGRRNNRTVGLFEAHTNAQGVFTRTARVKGTTDFTAIVFPRVDACATPSSESVDCLGSTTVAPDPGSTTLWMSVPTGAVRAIRAADQRRAEAIGLKASDLPEGYTSTFAGGDECLNPRHEPNLTITGESTSPAFFHYDVAEPSLVEAMGLTRLYATPQQARQAVAHQARMKTVRCVLSELDFETDIRPRIRTLRLPRVPASVHAFRAAFTEDDLTLNYDVIFLQRGRAVTILRIALLNAPADLESQLTAALAARL